MPEHRPNTQRGVSLLETVFYVSLFVLLSTMVIAALISTVGEFNRLRMSRDINDSAIQIMERITRDIKGGANVDLAQSTFGQNPGRLTLTTVNASGTPTVVEYSVSGDTLTLKENGVDKGSMTAGASTIDAFVLRYFNTGSIVSIKIELHLRATHGTQSELDHFYDTVIMRNTY